MKINGRKVFFTCIGIFLLTTSFGLYLFIVKENTDWRVLIGYWFGLFLLISVFMTNNEISKWKRMGIELKNGIKKEGEGE